MLKRFCDMVEYKVLLVQITATTGIDASLYQGRKTLQSLLGIGVDDKDSSNDGSSSRTLKLAQGRNLQICCTS